MAFLALAAAWSATATECGVGDTALMAPFAGTWSGEDGQSYEIAPGKIIATSTVHLVTGDEVHRNTSHFVADYDGEDPSESSLDCRSLSVEERDKIAAEMAELIDVMAAPGSEADRKNRRQIGLFRLSLAHPPYPMMVQRLYEDMEWLILLKPDLLLEVWQGEGLFSVATFRRGEPR